MRMQPIDSFFRQEETRREPQIFPCPVDGCERVMATARLLRGHVETNHSMQEEKAEMPVQEVQQQGAFPCDQCPRSFDTAQGVTLHRTRKHGPTKPKVQRTSQDGQAQDPELRALAGILRDVESLSPAGRAWLVARLST